MFSRRSLYWLLLMGLALALTGSGYAQLGQTAGRADNATEAIPGLGFLADRADRIVIGRATSVVSRHEATEWGDELIVSDVTIAVEEVLKGEAAPGGEIVLAGIWSGRIGDVAMASSDTPLFTEGERFVLFLETEPDGRLGIAGGDLGKVLIDESDGLPETGATLSRLREELQRIQSGLPATTDGAMPDGDNTTAPEELDRIEVSRGPNAPNYVFTGQRWAGASPIVNYYVDNPGINDTNAGSVDQQNTAIKLGADSWTVSSGARFTYNNYGLTSSSTAGNNGVNVIMVRNAANGTDLATAAWFFNTTTNLILDCDIVIWDANYAFSSTGAANRYDLHTVAMHEFGHCLGLNHSAVAQASMFATVGLGELRRTLQPDDLAGARLLYGVGSAAQWSNQYGYSAGGWRVNQHPRMMGDVNGDGRDDVVGFGGLGVFVSLSTGARFTPASLWVQQFSLLSGGWDVVNHPRFLADVNDDGMDDVVGFAGDGVYVSRSQGFGFEFPTRWVAGYGYGQGWRTEVNPRFMADVNGDDRADVVGFANDGVYVSLSTGSGFTTPTNWVASYGLSSGGWQVPYHPRYMADVNADGMDDVVGFADDGVWVSTSNGSAFSAPSRWIAGFGYVAGGWRVDRHPRFLSDVNGDGRADVVGFADDGVYVATSTGTSFAGASRWVAAYGASLGFGAWSVAHHPRFLADVNGDGMDDVVGFAGSGVFVATSTGTAFTSPIVPWVMTYGNTNGGWQVAFHPRMMADVDGDGRADIVGFGNAGVYVSRSAYPNVFE